MQLVICPKCSEAVPIERIDDHLSDHFAESNHKVEEHETKSAGG